MNDSCINCTTFVQVHRVTKTKSIISCEISNLVRKCSYNQILPVKTVSTRLYSFRFSVVSMNTCLFKTTTSHLQAKTLYKRIHKLKYAVIFRINANSSVFQIQLVFLRKCNLGTKFIVFNPVLKIMRKNYFDISHNYHFQFTH